MNVWNDIDRRLAEHRRALDVARRAARRTGWAWVKAHTTGVWSARRAARYEGGVMELHERSADALIVGMFLARHRGEPRRD